jgi:hypothetical protein
VLPDRKQWGRPYARIRKMLTRAWSAQKLSWEKTSYWWSH